MVYSANYNDDENSKNVRITSEDSYEALKNDYLEIMRTYDPKYVKIQRLEAKPGEAMHLKVIVNAPSHYLVGNEDRNPKPCNSMSVHIICYPGYPIRSVSAFYDPYCHLCSINVFHDGNACIDTWIPFTSSLTTVVDKLVRDIIHDPNVSRFDSMASPNLADWQRNGIKTGRFPTMNIHLLYKDTTPALPSHHTKNNRTPISLPKRH